MIHILRQAQDERSHGVQPTLLVLSLWKHARTAGAQK